MSDEKSTKEAAPKAEKAPKIEKNGVTRPKAGTSTATIWDIADEASRKAGKPAARKEVLDAATAAGLNVATAATQYGRWCKFHGVTPEQKPKAEKPAKAAKPKKGDVTTEAAGQ